MTNGMDPLTQLTTHTAWSATALTSSTALSADRRTSSGWRPLLPRGVRVAQGTGQYNGAGIMEVMSNARSRRFPVTITQLPVTRCQICHRTDGGGIVPHRPVIFLVSFSSRIRSTR